jgi:hypothetical protein
MYCSIGLPRITADKLARVHSQSCTSHGPQVVQRKQNKLNLLFAAQPLFPRPQAPRVWFDEIHLLPECRLEHPKPDETFGTPELCRLHGRDGDRDKKKTES